MISQRICRCHPALILSPPVRFFVPGGRERFPRVILPMYTSHQVIDESRVASWLTTLSWFLKGPA